MLLTVVRSAVLGIVLGGAMLLAGRRGQVPRSQSGPLAMLLFVAFGVVPALQALESYRDLRSFTPGDMLYQGPAARYEVWLRRKKLVATWVLVACVLCVAACQAKIDRTVWTWGTSVEAAGLVKPLPRGQSWRLLTCALLHGGILHLAVNLFALGVLGRWVEAHSRRVFLPSIFLATALVGSVASLTLAPHVKYSVGASGGLMGLIGFLTVMGHRRRHVLPDGFLRMMLVNIGMVFLLGLMARQVVDNACHFGGLVGGLALGLIIFRKPLSKFPGPLAVFLGVGSTLLLFATTLLAAGLILRAGGLVAVASTPPALVPTGPGLWDAAGRFRAAYDIPDTFRVTAGGLNAQPAAGGGPVVAQMVGAFLRPGFFAFQFARVDRFGLEYETRTVRVNVSPNGPEGPVLISPADAYWTAYPQGIVKARPSSAALIEWADQTPLPVPDGWRLVTVKFSPDTPSQSRGGLLLPQTMPTTRP